MGFHHNEQRVPQIGEVYLMNFGGSGCEQNGWRPGVVFQNNVGNAHSPNIIVKSADSGLRLDSMVLCENPECMSKERIGQYITTLSNRYMRQIAAANLLATSAISFLDTEVLLAVWHKAIRLNAAVPA